MSTDKTQPPTTAEILDAYATELDGVASLVEASALALRGLIETMSKQAVWSKAKETP